MPYLKLRDGNGLFYKDWGPPDGQILIMAIVLLHMTAEDMEGRPTQTWHGNNMDTFVDDLEELFGHLNVKNAVMVGHSHGGGEVTRFLGKHGTNRFKKAVLVGSVPPLMLKTSTNAEGTDKSAFDTFRQAMYNDRAQFFLGIPSGPFFGFNRPNAKKSEGLIRSWFQQGMHTSFKAAYDSKCEIFIGIKFDQ